MPFTSRPASAVAYRFASVTASSIATAGGTDARFFRERGAVAYGFGLFTPDMTVQEFASRFHGNDERVDVDSLALTTELWLELVSDVIG